MKSGKVVVE